MSRRPLVLFLTTLLLAMPGPQALADNGLPPRPDIADYEDQNRFVADVLAWEKQVKARRTNPTPAPESRPAGEHDWHHITGPEDLDVALRNAHGYEQPHYKEPLRYNRTTHISFPLQHLGFDEMASQTAAGDARTPQARPLSEMETLPAHLIEQLDRLQLFSARETQPDQLGSITGTN